MNIFLSTLAIIFQVMLPAWPSFLIALILIHVAIRLRREEQVRKGWR